MATLWRFESSSGHHDNIPAPSKAIQSDTLSQRQYWLFCLRSFEVSPVTSYWAGAAVARVFLGFGFPNDDYLAHDESFGWRLRVLADELPDDFRETHLALD